jgi:hypothetical protein
MNNLYHWQDERMVDLEMKEIQREIANANLLREAGLSGNDWLARAVNAFFKLLRTRSPGERRFPEQRSYRSHRENAAR